ncbi:MAG: CvpA family protein [Mariprofundales bacterium]
MNPFDYLLLGLIGVSTVLSLWRGFVREIVSLLGLIAAFVVASQFSGLGGEYLEQWLDNRMLADTAAFILLFIITMICVALVGVLLGKLVDSAELTATDRTLGMFFGLARGILIIGLFFLIFTSFVKDQPNWMDDSALSPYANELGDALGYAIPQGYPFSRHKGILDIANDEVMPKTTKAVQDGVNDGLEKGSEQVEQIITDAIDEVQKSTK